MRLEDGKVNANLIQLEDLRDVRIPHIEEALDVIEADLQARADLAEIRAREVAEAQEKRLQDMEARIAALEG